MPLKINVPYSEKDLAKEKGAFWDKDNKTWFVPDYKDINLFSQWIDTDKVSIIAKAPFWIGVTQKTCWKCGGMIDVIAFASNKFWIYEYSDDDVWGIERSGFFNGREKWAKDFENQRV